MIKNSPFLNLDLIHSLADDEVLSRTFIAAKKEQAATLDLLEYLTVVDTRRLYAKLEYSSLFDYLVKKLGYSEMQASDRVNATRLMRSVPAAKAQIKSGELNITVASQVQRFFNQEKNHGDRALTKEEKEEVIESCAGKSKREVEKELFSRQSEPVKVLKKESIKEVSEKYTELKFLIDDATFQKLEETKNLFGDESLEKIFTEALEALNEKLKKKKGMSSVKRDDSESSKSTFPGKESTTNGASKEPQPLNGLSIRSRFISIHAKREVFKRSKGQCEWVANESGVRCQSRYKLEIDHILAFAKNGSNDAGNLRHLCRNHNHRAAVEAGLSRWDR